MMLDFIFSFLFLPSLVFATLNPAPSSTAPSSNKSASTPFYFWASTPFWGYEICYRRTGYIEIRNGEIVIESERYEPDKFFVCNGQIIKHATLFIEDGDLFVYHSKGSRKVLIDETTGKLSYESAKLSDSLPGESINRVANGSWSFFDGYLYHSRGLLSFPPYNAAPIFVGGGPPDASKTLFTVEKAKNPVSSFCEP